MPRQGVPYPSREICSLKCQIDALQRQINELMKSINGVEGDGQGNVSLISGDPAVVISNDAVQNKIEISLDSSELPAADVSSVNSQTGAVVLNATDIIAQGYNKNVERVLDDIYLFAAQTRTNLNSEIYRSTNADSTMQTNFNALQASIPGEAANAVANDPTVTQLATDVPNKLDKITSGSSLKAYTHTGATQGEKSVVDGVDADSIGIRDANGRMHAADPASGATDKTLVTSNWVSQTGDSGPNNLLHRSGNESKNGNLTLLKPLFITRPDNGQCYIQTTDLGFDLVTPPGSTNTRLIIDTYDKNSKRFLSLYEGTRANGSKLMNFTIRNYDTDGNTNGQASLILNLNADGTCELRMQDGLGNNIQVAHT